MVGDVVYDVEMELWREIERIKGKEAPIYYDVTPVYTCSERLEIALLGGPGGRKLLQINIGLVVSRPNAFPIMHRIFPGNVTDKATLGEISALLGKKFGLRKNMVILDRGFDPKTVLKCLRDAKLG